MLARRLRGTPIKLLVSCKSSSWSTFTENRGTYTGLSYLVFKRKDVSISGVALEHMTADEFSSALERYRGFYGVRGAFEDAAYAAAKESPFLLRILFQVAAAEKAKHLTFSSVQFFKRYLQESISRLRRPREAIGFLTALARTLFDNGCERIPVQVVYDDFPQYRPDILEELIEYQILEASPLGAVGTQLGFYFSLLRDYIVVFHCKRWHEATITELRKELGELAECDVHQDAIVFFYRYSGEERKRLIDGPVRARANQYLILHERILNEDFSAFRDQLPPFTDGPVGFVGHLIFPDCTLGTYDLRSRRADEASVLLVPKSKRSSSGRMSNLPYILGAQGLHGSSTFMKGGSVEDEVLNGEIVSGLINVIDEGVLNESVVPELLMEAVAAIVARDRSVFSDERNEHSAGAIFPLSLQRVRHWLRYELLNRHFEQQRIDAKVREGLIPVKRHESGSISYNSTPTLEDRRWIKEQINAHLGDADNQIRDLVARSISHEFGRLDQRLSKAISYLEAYGCSEILCHPLGDLTQVYRERRMRPGRVVPASYRQAMFDHIERVLTISFRIFITLVKHNFPSLYGSFPTIASRPHTIVAAVDLARQNHEQRIVLYLCEHDPESTQFVLVSHDELCTRTSRAPRFRLFLEFGGRQYVRREFPEAEFSYPAERSISVESLFRPRRRHIGDDPLRIYSNGKVQPILRSAVYQWIRHDLEYVLQELCRRYGASMEEERWTFSDRE